MFIKLDFCIYTSAKPYFKHSLISFNEIRNMLLRENKNFNNKHIFSYTDQCHAIGACVGDT